MHPVGNTREYHLDLLTYRHIDVVRTSISSPQPCGKIIRAVMRGRAICG